MSSSTNSTRIDAGNVAALRVLHIVAGNLYGGVESYLATVAKLRKLAPNLHQEFGICFGGRLRDELTASGAIVHDLGAVRLSRPLSVRRARLRFENLLSVKKFDAVTVHGCWPHIIFARSINRLGVMLVHVAHNTLETSNWINRLAAFHPPDLVLANSKFTAARAQQLFIGVPVEVCYLPVEPPQLPTTTRNDVRRELGTSKSSVVVLMASRLDSMKGHRELLNALARIPRGPEWECWIAGGAQRPNDARNLSELKAVATSHGLADHVRFLGHRGDIRRLFAAADLYCQPNLAPESFGLSFIEALYAGLTVVTSDFGGAAEILQTTAGLLLPPGDELKLSQALRHLIYDNNLRDSFSAIGPKRALELCDPVAHLQSFEHAIRHALTRRD